MQAEWAAAAPGAGFAELAEYQRLKPADIEAVPWWERKLWNLYNATAYAGNLFNVPVVAYSGEIDRQKQAADIMARYMKEEGLTLRHVIGPKTEHRYHPDSKVVIAQGAGRDCRAGPRPVPEAVETRDVHAAIQPHEVGDYRGSRQTLGCRTAGSGRRAERP